MKNSPQQLKVDGDPTFSFLLPLFKGGSLDVTKLFHFSTGRTKARLGFVLNRSLFQLVYIQNAMSDKQYAAVLNGR